MVSGDRALLFFRPYLEFDADNWIGFNKEKSFVNAPPDPGILKNSQVFIPGTAYNLCFVMKGEDENEQ